VVFTAVGQAGASVASQLLGARRHGEAPVAHLALITFNLGLGLLTSLLFLSLHRLLPSWLGLSGAVADYASTYLGIIGSFQFLKATQIAYGNVLNSRGLTQWVMAEALLTNICNIGLNLWFMHDGLGLGDWGVARVALATVISLGFGLLFTVAVVRFHLRVKLPLRPEPRAFKHRLRQVLGIGLPSALEPAAYQAAQLAVNALIISWGAATLAARTYTVNFVIVTTILWSAALGIGTQIMVAHRVGAERFAEANRELHRALTFGISGNFVIALLLALVHRPLLGTLTSDPEIFRIAEPLFWLGLFVEPCRAVNIVAGGALRSSGDARYTALVGSFMMWTVGVPACYFLGRRLGLGLPGVYLGLGLDELARGLVNYRRWRKGRWKEFRLSVRPAAE
jgi:putative MATE family efflux protein